MIDIKNSIGKPALLEQLAEEASELAKAALKHARILRGENPTPVTEVEAHTSVLEEYTDVIHCSIELGLTVNQDQINAKDKRWRDRIIAKVLEADKNMNGRGQ